jgi:hypothetical protein
MNVDSRWLFVKTCQDLLGKSKSPDYYDKLRMAGLLKHLLAGPRSLLAQVNRDPALPLEFWFREPGEDLAVWVGPAGFDASRREAASGQVQRGDLALFLQARVVHCHQWLTVEQLLLTVAHAYGGFLSDVPEGLSREAMVAVDEAIQEGGTGPVSVAMQEITGVTLRALIPLANPSGPPRPRSRPQATGAAAVSAPGCPFSGEPTGD